MKGGNDKDEYLRILVDRFMDDPKKNTLVISGYSGAGKSSFMKFFEREKMTEWKLNTMKEEKEAFVLPIYVRLA